MSNILITGITGFTGFYLVEYLEEIKKNMNIIGIGRHAPNNEYNYEFIKCDLLNSDIIKDIVKAVKPDYVFHLAGLTRSSNLKLLYDVNVIGSINLLEALKAIKELVDPKILILGSSAEYGIVKENELPISENNHLRPITHYGVSKVSQDLLGYQYYANYGLKIIRVRPFNLIGPGQSCLFCIRKADKQNREEKFKAGIVCR
jgi:GDP-4-dehydro-6-deoxy-D-mannose reductase